MDRLEKKNRFDGSLCFGAKKFYDVTGRTAQVSNGEEEKIFKRFGDPVSGLIKKEHVRHRKCICGADDAMPFFVKNGFKFVMCRKCAFLYVNPILKEGILSDFYRNEEGWFKVLQNPIQVEMDTLKFSYGLDMIERHGKKGGLLDIGCGTCLFLDIARGRGWKTTGVEFNAASLKIAKDKALDVKEMDINSRYFDDKRYDAIALWEVLEHVADPREMLKRIALLLNPGARVLILVPNKDSLINRMLREKSDTFTGHCHINYFNAKTLESLLDEEGFKILEKETIVSELTNVKNWLSYQDAYHGDRHDELSFITPSLIHENMVGCKLLILAGIS